jgi:hypothetical protein
MKEICRGSRFDFIHETVIEFSSVALWFTMSDQVAVPAVEPAGSLQLVRGLRGDMSTGLGFQSHSPRRWLVMGSNDRVSAFERNSLNWERHSSTLACSHLERVP